MFNPNRILNVETIDLGRDSRFHVDHTYSLGPDGVIIIGWHLVSLSPITEITIHGSNQAPVDISSSMSRIPRLDVMQAMNLGRMKNQWCGFICYASMPTWPGNSRSLHFKHSNGDTEKFDFSITKSKQDGNDLIREVLSKISGLDQLSSVLHNIFDAGLGAAIETIAENKSKSAPEVCQRQFGTPASQTKVSVIIPLYGRSDFVRHQLAHFHDDPEFDDVDLIYVIDDPDIYSSTVGLSTACYELYGKPFRLLFYNQNLGFSGANNVGVAHAKSDLVLLMNSDILPISPGWLSELRNAMETLPQACAVAPVLLFHDNSIQHGGMEPYDDPYWPGFLLNKHPGKGQFCNLENEPTEQTLLSAACLMVRKKDYEDIGGFDEGYVIGDFEDSDLCLSLKQNGGGLWLVPEARLWHLERQTQGLIDTNPVRQLITMYNAWRYKNKIDSGQLTNPLKP